MSVSHGNERTTATMTVNQRTIDAARGTVVGALIGDAVGAKLEFLGRVPTAIEIEEALQMPGGGVCELAPGQVTDDGELTLSLADALIEAGGFDIEVIARHYAA
jgi:ADP-ribosylglycohydrolase